MARHVEVELPAVPCCIVVRQVRSGDLETLLLFEDGIFSFDLCPRRGIGAFALGEPLELAPNAIGKHCGFPAYDASTNSVYFCNSINGFSDIVRMDAKNTVSNISASEHGYGTTTGDNQESRQKLPKLTLPLALVADGLGSAFVLESTRRVTKVGLTDGSVQGLQLSQEYAEVICSLAYHPPSKVLFAASNHALYRVQTDGRCELFAGEESSPGDSIRDGLGAGARFADIGSLAVAPDGHSLYVMDRNVLRRVELWTREVSTLIELEAGAGDRSFGGGVAVLPQGAGVAVLLRGQKKVYVVQGLEHSGGLSSGHSGASNDGISARELTSQLPLLLQQPESGSALVTLRVGGPSGRVFSAHRSVLCSRSEYFRGLLAGGFREDDSREVELPDVDPYCFAPVLAFMYTGTLGDVLAENLRPTAELFGRLLVPMPAALQQQLMAAATPASMISDLAWAERHRLRDLARALKEKTVREFRLVMKAVPPEALSQMMVEVPDLMTEIVKLGVVGPRLP